MGIVEVCEAAFTKFQLMGSVYRQWQAYEEGRPADVAPLTWAQFSKMFLKEFVPHTLRDAWRTEFEQLHQVTMTAFEYALRFSKLSRQASALVSTTRESPQIFRGAQLWSQMQDDMGAGD
ncbi:uncharacterized protein [Nicotiana tomentosiformis]|uniref:uncharacterized protein n=1 Tax=Nicotiana tomentosiformis TaxID=4098 RepID=UPI00388C953D